MQYARFNHAPPVLQNFNDVLLCKLALAVKQKQAIRARLAPLAGGIRDDQFDDWFEMTFIRIQNVLDVATAYNFKIKVEKC
jgi:hypothetical protein